MYKIDSKIISTIIFSILVIISILSFNQFIFPKLLIELTSEFPSNTQNIFELGFWAYPLLVSNIIFVIILILFKFQKSHLFKQLIRLILDFDLSKKTTVLCIIIFFSIYLIFTIDEFSHHEFGLGDYSIVFDGLDNIELFYDGHANYFILRHIILKTSIDVFDNIRILPFLSTLGLLSLTYLFTVKISGKRISGIIALIIVMQSNLFLLFDTTATYENFWTTFFIFSLYLLLTKSYLSPVSYIFSILTKVVSFLFFPIMMALILFSDISQQRKKILLIIYSIFPIVFILLLTVFQIFNLEQFTTFHTRDFWTGLSSISNSLRFDGVILIMFFPTLILLYLKSKNDFKYANFLMFSLTVLLFIPPLLSSLGGYTNQPYRIIPLIIMTSISVGFLFSKIKEFSIK